MNNSLYIWDVDDVLNNLTKDFINYITPSIPYETILNPNIHDSLGLSQDDYLYELDNFRRREYLNLKPNLDLTNFIKSRKNSMHYVLTSVPHEFIEISFCWVKRNFDKTFFGYLFAPSRRENGNLKMPIKRDHLNNLNLFGRKTFFIDDNPYNFINIDNTSITKVLWPQPWNSSGKSLKKGEKYIEKLFEENLNECT